MRQNSTSVSPGVFVSKDRQTDTDGRGEDPRGWTCCPFLFPALSLSGATCRTDDLIHATLVDAQHVHRAAAVPSFPFCANLARPNRTASPAGLCRARFLWPLSQWSVHGADVHSVQPIFIQTSSAEEEISHSHAGLSPPGKHTQGYLERHTCNANLLFEALDELKGQLHNKAPRGKELVCLFNSGVQES